MLQPGTAVVSSTNSYHCAGRFKVTFPDLLPSSYQMEIHNIDHAYKM